jgi:hypothetical protein
VEEGERRRDLQAALVGRFRQVGLMVGAGRLEEVMAQAVALREEMTKQGAELAGRLLAVTFGLRAPLHLGRATQALSWVEAWIQGGGGTLAERVRRAQCWAQMGRDAEARAALGEILTGAVGQSGDATPTLFLAPLLEVAVLLGEQAAVARLTGWLRPVAGWYEPYAGVAVGRLMGEAAVLLGDYGAVRDYYAQGQAVAEKLKHRPELALISLDLAELDAAGGDAAAARERLDFCIPELREMKMAPALARAEALRQRLG